MIFAVVVSELNILSSYERLNLPDHEHSLIFVDIRYWISACRSWVAWAHHVRMCSPKGNENVIGHREIVLWQMEVSSLIFNQWVLIVNSGIIIYVDTLPSDWSLPLPVSSPPLPLPLNRNEGNSRPRRQNCSTSSPSHSTRIVRSENLRFRDGWFSLTKPVPVGYEK